LSLAGFPKKKICIAVCAVFIFFLILLFIPYLFVHVIAEDTEFHLSDIPKEPRVYIEAPAMGSTIEHGMLIVKVTGEQTDYIEAVLEWTDAEGESHYVSAMSHTDTLEHTFYIENMCFAAKLLVIGSCTDQKGETNEVTIMLPILSPKEELINRMIALAEKNSKQDRYKFAPAQSDTDIGVCKNFVMRLFDTYKNEYRMVAYPDLPLHMPKNNSKAACAPYDYGIEWRPENAEDGSPFEIVFQFKYDNNLSKTENAAIARDMMHRVKKGDFFQMVGDYGGGNGPHSLYFIADYNPADDSLNWTDSNMRGTRINGERWGYLQFNATATAEWYVKVFNMKKRGATLYRLRDDLYKP